MSAGAIMMMLVAMMVIWGGLALAVVNLSRSKEPHRTDEVHRDL
jgi:hypothetical protein